MVTKPNINLEFLLKPRTWAFTGLVTLAAMLPNLSFGNVPQTQKIIAQGVSSQKFHFLKGKELYEKAKKPRQLWSAKESLLEQASCEFTKALKENPNDAETLRLLGDINVVLENCTTAIGYLQRAVNIKKTEENLCSLVDAYECAGEYESAANTLQKVYGLNKNSVLARKKSGYFAYKQERFDDAILLWEEALKYAPNDYGLNINLGGAYLKLNNLKLAEKYAREGVKLNPDCPNGQYVLGLVYEAKGNVRKAIAAFKKAVELSPSAKNYRIKLESLEKR